MERRRYYISSKNVLTLTTYCENPLYPSSDRPYFHKFTDNAYSQNATRLEHQLTVPAPGINIPNLNCIYE